MLTKKNLLVLVESNGYSPDTMHTIQIVEQMVKDRVTCYIKQMLRGSKGVRP